MAHTLTPSEQIAHCTVRIEVETPEGQGTGTGFFFNFAEGNNQNFPAIVTNKHVIAGALRGKFHLTFAGADGNPDYGSHKVFELDNFYQRWIQHPDPDVDLCAMPIGFLLNEVEKQGKNVFYIPLNKSLISTDIELADMTAMEDVIMVGYPNGIWDEKNNMPVFRQGITATHPNLNWNGKSEFLIDAACFPGSSGSPVFLYNLAGYATKSGGMMIGRGRIKLLGVLYAGPQHTVSGDVRIVPVPTINKAISISTIPNNLGIIIKAERIKELDTIITNLIRKSLPWSAASGPYSAR